MVPTAAQDKTGIQKQAAAATFVSRNAKTVVSLLGGVINVLAVSAALFRWAPADVAGMGSGLLAVVELLRTVNVWIVRNEPALETAAVELADAPGPGAA